MDDLELVAEAGPRIITPDTPVAVREEIGRRARFGGLRAAMQKMKLETQAALELEIEYTCRMNRIKEQTMHATRSHVPEASIPLALIHALEAQEKDSWNPDMREDTLRCYPGLRLNVKFGVHGQEYVKGR